MSRVTLQNLQVFRAVAPGKHIQLDDRHNRREIQAIRNIIDRSLLIYETPRGRAALAHHAQRVVIGLNGASLYPANDPTFARMPLYIDSFLRSLRSDFPQVYIENDGDEDAAFARTAWAPTAPGTTLDSCVFVASRSGKMYMCLDVSAIAEWYDYNLRFLSLCADKVSSNSRSWTKCSSPRTMTIFSYGSSTWL